MQQPAFGCRWRGDALSCPDIPRGHHRLRLSPTAAAFVDELLQRRNEVAGALAIDFQNGALHVVQNRLSKGKRDNVGIPRGAVIAMHTHPGKCPPRGADCALDVPSDADMALVMEDCMQGTDAHWIFAHTGTFTISLTPQLRHHLASVPFGKRKAAEKEIEKVFAAAHKTFERRLQSGGTDLDRFRPEWCALARQQGFKVQFFPKGVPPETVLVVD